MSPSQERWQRLGDLLIQRRVALHPHYRYRNAFADDTGINWRRLYDIEKAGRTGRTGFPRSTIAEFETAYQLQPGAIWAFLDGDEDTLVPLPEPEPEPPARVRRHFDDPRLQRMWDENEAYFPEKVLLGGVGFMKMLMDALDEDQRSA